RGLVGVPALGRSTRVVRVAAVGGDPVVLPLRHGSRQVGRRVIARPADQLGRGRLDRRAAAVAVCGERDRARRAGGGPGEGGGVVDRVGGQARRGGGGDGGDGLGETTIAERGARVRLQAVVRVVVGV